MTFKRRHLIYGSIVVSVALLIILSVAGPALGQQAVDNGKQKILDKVLSYINTIAKAIGGFLIYIITKITGTKLSKLVMPLGYLGEITIILLALEIIEGAKKFLWFLLLAGWALIAVRVVMEIVQAKPA